MIFNKKNLCSASNLLFITDFYISDNRTLPVLGDLSYAFNELKISLPELEEFVNSVESVPFPDVLPKLPLVRPPQLNLLKPGSREIVSRPIHIHEHLPPMMPDKEGK